MSTTQKFRAQYDVLRFAGYAHCKALTVMAEAFIVAEGTRQQWLRGISAAGLPRGTARSMWHNVKKEMTK